MWTTIQAKRTIEPDLRGIVFTECFMKANGVDPQNRLQADDYLETTIAAGHPFFVRVYNQYKQDRERQTQLGQQLAAAHQRLQEPLSLPTVEIRLTAAE